MCVGTICCNHTLCSLRLPFMSCSHALMPSLHLLLCSTRLMRLVLNFRAWTKVPQPKHVRLRHFLLGVMKLKDVFSVLLCLGCLPFYFCHLFSLNFCDEICFAKNNKLSCLSCCSVLLQHVCCFGFILYPPRSPQEVWRVWWVASCFWVRDPPKARFFPPAFSETTGVLRKLQNLSVCGAENDFLVNTV